MKTATSLLFCASLLAATTTAHAVQTGDDRAAVLSEMGQPTGEITSGPVAILLYPRGEVRLRDGRVTTINLVTEDELARRESAEAAAKERAQLEQAARLARLEAEGRALRTAKHNDSTFVEMSAIDQLAYWRAFATHYPMVPVADEMAALRPRAREEERLAQVDRANEERLANLEARLAETENRAARAEEEVRRARYNPWGFFSTGRPYTIHAGNDRPRENRDGPRARDHHRESDRSQPETQAATTDDDPRARAMAEIEAARRAAYQAANT